jgi:hypothetical protein
MIYGYVEAPKSCPISCALRCGSNAVSGGLGGSRLIRDLGQDDGRQRARPGKSVPRGTKFDSQVGLVH